MKWPDKAPKSRRAAAEALTTITMALTAAGPTCPHPCPGSAPNGPTPTPAPAASREPRGLKRRSAAETSSIPILPVLTGILRDHLDRYGAGPGGIVFRTARNQPVNDTGYTQVWKRARQAALTPAQQPTQLARRAYDLRHACVSLWLNTVVPATEVARRAGHGVAVLLRGYANCIDGRAAAANKCISAALDPE
jgi:hypothetical protein